MLSKLKVYGRLARFLGQRTFEAEINSPIDAIRFLTANFPALQSHMIEQNYCVKVGDYEINDKELDIPVGQQEIKIVPVAIGARRGIGSIFIRSSSYWCCCSYWRCCWSKFRCFWRTLVFGLKAGATATLGTSLLAAAGNIGIYLALSGAAEMLTPTPEDTNFDDPNSFNFNGI